MTLKSEVFTVLSCLFSAVHSLTPQVDQNQSSYNSSLLKHSVLASNFPVDGYVCGGTNTLIFWPDAQGVFPVVVYAHGSMGGVDGRQASLEEVSSYGLVVIAPDTGPENDNSCTSESEWADIVTALQASKNGGKRLNAGLAKINWNAQVGIWGYSMGGKTSPQAVGVVENKGFGVGAVVCSHGARNGYLIPSQVPSLFITGTADFSSSPADLMLREFQESKSQHKVFANLQGGEHTWPITKRVMDPWVAKFFGCHIAIIGSFCDEVYGGQLCSANAYAQCTVV